MSEQPNDGGPAFPPTFGLSGECGVGMSLRDWFAGQADVSNAMHLLDRENCETLIGKPMPDDFVGMVGWHFDVVARLRLMSADAMLAARKDPS